MYVLYFFMLKINLQFILALYENSFGYIILFVDIIFFIMHNIDTNLCKTKKNKNKSKIFLIYL